MINELYKKLKEDEYKPEDAFRKKELKLPDPIKVKKVGDVIMAFVDVEGPHDKAVGVRIRRVLKPGEIIGYSRGDHNVKCRFNVRKNQWLVVDD